MAKCRRAGIYRRGSGTEERLRDRNFMRQPLVAEHSRGCIRVFTQMAYGAPD